MNNQNNFSKNKGADKDTKRSIDQSLGSVNKMLQKDLFLIGKRSLNSWKALSAITLIAGFFGALIWAVSLDALNPLRALQEGQKVENTAFIYFEDNLGNSQELAYSNKVSIPIKQSQPVGEVSLSLVPASGNYGVGDSFSVEVQLDTGGNDVDGVDLHYLQFDPSLLQVVDYDSTTIGVQVKPGQLLDITTINEIDNDLGTINFSQTTTGSQTYKGQGVLAVINFSVKSAGSASVVFDYTPGSTTDTNVASGVAEDILAKVNNASFNFTNLNTAPVITPISNQEMGQGETLGVDISALDAEGNTIVLTASNLPSFGTLIDHGDGNGRIIFTPAFSDTGSYKNIIIKASDNAEIPLSSSISFDLNINKKPARLFSLKLTLQAKEKHAGQFRLKFFKQGTAEQLEELSAAVNDLGQVENTATANRLEDGKYDIVIQIPYYLSKKLENVTWPPTQEIDFGELLAGNLQDSDDIINSLDWSLMNAAWGNTSDIADINQDGIVNSLDWSVMNRNWGKSGSL